MVFKKLCCGRQSQSQMDTEERNNLPDRDCPVFPQLGPTQ
jgi:hypothetical protein